MDTIKLPLPYPVPHTRWVSAEPTGPHFEAMLDAFMAACKNPGWNPKTVNMGNGMFAIDFCATEDGRFHSYKVAHVEDHPFMATLPENAPRVVKHVFRAETRMKYLRARCASDFLSDMSRAEDAAAQYNRANQGNIKSNEVMAGTW